MVESPGRFGLPVRQGAADDEQPAAAGLVEGVQILWILNWYIDGPEPLGGQEILDQGTEAIRRSSLFLADRCWWIWVMAVGFRCWATRYRVAYP